MGYDFRGGLLGCGLLVDEVERDQRHLGKGRLGRWQEIVCTGVFEGGLSRGKDDVRSWEMEQSLQYLIGRCVKSPLIVSSGRSRRLRTR